MASAQTPVVVTIDVDAEAAGTPLEPVWAFYGYDEVNYTTTPEGEKLLRTLSAAHTAPVHIRTHFLFNTRDGMPALKWGSTNIYTEDAGGNPVYDYTLIDQIMDETVQAGAFPLVEIGFMPQALSTRPDPYDNSDTYVLDGGGFYPRGIRQVGGARDPCDTHVKDRYRALIDRQWELWNEPDIGYWQKPSKSTPGFTTTPRRPCMPCSPMRPRRPRRGEYPRRQLLTQFLEHCATGTNASPADGHTPGHGELSRQGRGVIITNGHVQMSIGIAAPCTAQLNAVARSASSPERRFVISEAVPTVCACTEPRYAYRNSPALRLRGGDDEALARARGRGGCNLRGVLTWAFTFPDLSLLRRLPRAHDERHSPAGAERVQAARQPQR